MHMQCRYCFSSDLYRSGPRIYDFSVTASDAASALLQLLAAAVQGVLASRACRKEADW
jgi:hypothetical protein